MECRIGLHSNRLTKKNCAIGCAAQAGFQTYPKHDWRECIMQPTSESPAALSPPFQVPWVSPLGAPAEPDRPLASSVRTDLERVCPSPVRIPSLSHHRYRLRPDDSSVSRSL